MVYYSRSGGLPLFTGLVLVSGGVLSPCEVSQGPVQLIEAVLLIIGAIFALVETESDTIT